MKKLIMLVSLVAALVSNAAVMVSKQYCDKNAEVAVSNSVKLLNTIVPNFVTNTVNDKLSGMYETRDFSNAVVRCSPPVQLPENIVTNGTNISVLNNDAGFVRGSDIHIPSQVSAFVNDANYQNGTQVTNAVTNAVNEVRKDVVRPQLIAGTGIRIYYADNNRTNIVICVDEPSDGFYSPEGGSTVVTDIDYNSTRHSLLIQKATEVWERGVLKRRTINPSREEIILQ